MGRKLEEGKSRLPVRRGVCVSRSQAGAPTAGGACVQRITSHSHQKNFKEFFKKSGTEREAQRLARSDSITHGSYFLVAWPATMSLKSHAHKIKEKKKKNWPNKCATIFFFFFFSPDGKV